MSTPKETKCPNCAGRRYISDGGGYDKRACERCRGLGSFEAYSFYSLASVETTLYKLRARVKQVNNLVRRMRSAKRRFEERAAKKKK